MTKKGVLTLFLSLFLLAGLFAASVMVHAEDPAEPSVPDDAFDGAYEEFKGSDGTVTQVFDNGSVITTYKDGSKFGVDYAGNQHAKATDGTYSVGLTDGSIAIEYPDGRQSLYEPDKDTITTVNPDSTMTTEYVSLGLVVDMNAEGEQTGIGFIGGGERLGYNEDGTVADGAIKGPNGASLTVDDGNVTAVSPEGKKMEYRYDSSTGEDPAKEIIRITAPDGSTAEREISISWEQAADGTWQRCEASSETIKYADGTAIYRNINEIFHDEYGFSSEGRFIEETWTSADGETFTRVTAKFNDTVDPDSGERLTGEASKWEYSNPNTGEHAATDFFGHPVDLQKDGVSYHAEYDENGELRSVDMSEGGCRFIGNSDGSWSFTREDGTVFNGDKKNIWKNGAQIQKDGKWVEGYDPSEDFGNKEQESSGGTEWVEPYSYFGASDVIELYSYLKEVHPVAMEVTPAYCYDNNGGAEIDFTNKETFVIDMTDGAQTTYTTSYVDGDPAYGRDFRITYTFTGKPSDDGKYGSLMDVSTKGTIYWRQSGNVYEEVDEPECAVYSINVPKHSREKSGGKALHVGNGTVYSIDFIIERICIPKK